MKKIENIIKWVVRIGTVILAAIAATNTAGLS
jgi:hypothetical protein